MSSYLDAAFALRRLVAMSCIVIALATASTSHAQTATLTVTLPVRDVMQLQVSSIATITIPTPTANHYANVSVPVVTGPGITVKSNRAWTLTVSTATPNFTYAPGGSGLSNPSKPVSDVQWGTTNFTAAGNLGTPAAMPMTAGATGAATNYQPTAGATATLFLRTSWLITRDVPGSYSTTIRLTLSTP